MLLRHYQRGVVGREDAAADAHGNRPAVGLRPQAAGAGHFHAEQIHFAYRPRGEVDRHHVSRVRDAANPLPVLGQVAAAHVRAGRRRHRSEVAIAEDVQQHLIGQGQVLLDRVRGQQQRAPVGVAQLEAPLHGPRQSERTPHLDGIGSAAADPVGAEGHELRRCRIVAVPAGGELPVEIRRPRPGSLPGRQLVRGNRGSVRRGGRRPVRRQPAAEFGSQNAPVLGEIAAETAYQAARAQVGAGKLDQLAVAPQAGGQDQERLVVVARDLADQPLRLPPQYEIPLATRRGTPGPVLSAAPAQLPLALIRGRDLDPTEGMHAEKQPVQNHRLLLPRVGGTGGRRRRACRLTGVGSR